ncbi:MAG: ATP-binding protein [Sphingobium sp.]
MTDRWGIDEDEIPRWRQIAGRFLAFMIGVPLVVAIAALLYLTSVAGGEREGALAQQQRSYEIISLARRLDGSIAKAESNLARYVISMEGDTGRLYQEQWLDAGSELTALKYAIRNDAVQRQHVAQLEQAYIERGKTLNDIGLRTRYDQKAASLAKFYEAGRDQNLTRITTTLQGVIDTENAHLQARNLDVTRATNLTQQITNTYRLVGLGLLVAVLSAAWAARAAINERRQESRIADAAAFRAEQLERAVAVRTAELEQANIQLQREAANRSAAEESLRQMQKMEAVGQLTGGIAHDFNNMLAVVVGGLELARRKIEGAPSEARRHIDNAMQGANRATALTRRLLAFARAEPHLPEAVQPDDLVRGMIDLIDRTIGDQIAVNLQLESDGWAVFIDQHQMENAILNLAVNARDAMEGKGTLTISTGQARLNAREIGECLAGEYMSLSVADTGCGMAPEVLERAFEPFFTTKPVGKGTGLGLSQIFGFIRQCNGEIQIMSQPDKGTDVQIYLPRHHAIGAIKAPTATSPKRKSSGEETPTRAVSILLVEDDPRVLAQTRAALMELGHQAVCCDHPDQAIAALDKHPKIGLILTDVLMPGMNGPEMIAALPPRHRNVPVLFISGYAGNVADNRLFDGYKLLRKPYTLNGLAEAIDAAISESPQLRTSAATG